MDDKTTWRDYALLGVFCIVGPLGAVVLYLFGMALVLGLIATPWLISEFALGNHVDVGFDAIVMIGLGIGLFAVVVNYTRVGDVIEALFSTLD